MQKDKREKAQKAPNIFVAIVPFAVTIGVLMWEIFYYKNFDPQVPMILGIATATIIGFLHGYSWSDIQKGVFHVVSVSLSSIFIVLMVGMIVAIWIASGTVPSIIYYGLQIITPSYFLGTAMLLCAIVSISLGTSWTTTGTVGLAMMAIGSGFGFPAYWTAGAVVSGAFFGDKMSPLSDTTNLAPAVTGIDIFDHIKNMFATTGPAMVIAFILYIIAGFALIQGGQTASFDKINSMESILNAKFNISWLTLSPLVLVIIMAYKKMPAIPTLFAGVLLAAFFAYFMQGDSVHSMISEAYNGHKMQTTDPILNKLLNRGGIGGMGYTVFIIIFALMLGGALEATQCLQAILKFIVSRVRSFAGLQITSTLSSIFVNMCGDVYLSLALPGRMYSPAYRRIKYSTLNLSRCLEEGGTLVSPLIPWNVGGSIVITFLGLGIYEGNYVNLWYIPLSFANWMSPTIGVIYAIFGKFCPKATEAEMQMWKDKDELVLKLD